MNDKNKQTKYSCTDFVKVAKRSRKYYAMHTRATSAAVNITINTDHPVVVYFTPIPKDLVTNIGALVGVHPYIDSEPVITSYTEVANDPSLRKIPTLDNYWFRKLVLFPESQIIQFAMLKGNEHLYMIDNHRDYDAYCGLSIDIWEVR